MTRESFQTQLERLKHDLLKMGTLVEQAIEGAVRSLQEKDAQLAQKVIEGDAPIDDLEHSIEQNCLNLLALQQPMAGDLRAIGTALKIITDLERMADNSVDIAQVTLRLEGQPLIKPLVDIPRMADIAREMTREALTAFIHRDVDLAYKMIEKDDQIDGLYNQIFRELVFMMMQDPSIIAQATHLLFVARHLERIGDHATNLGEWVIYMVTGERKELND